MDAKLFNYYQARIFLLKLLKESDANEATVHNEFITLRCDTASANYYGWITTEEWLALREEMKDIEEAKRHG